jgi:3-hydroxyacyl-CoA dehydrogenase / enoyl-CoA hydratase / 3-hydroxybutyryl-CoA epimerase / enoyl-CoA isomerase
MLGDAADGKLDWKARREEKKAPLKLNPVEAGMVFLGGKAFVAGKAGPHYPAPVAAIEVMEKGAGTTRDEALAIEAAGFAKVAKTPAATPSSASSSATRRSRRSRGSTRRGLAR